MTRRVLNVFAGEEARARIAKEGWHADLFSALFGASGGPKWLVLSQLDRLLFGEFFRRRNTPLLVYGTSIGSWRHACLAQHDPRAAIERLERAYIHQSYSAKPDTVEITEVSRTILATMLGPSGLDDILDNQSIVTHIGSARDRGPRALGRKVGVPLFFLGAGAANAVRREALGRFFQRVVFAQDSTRTLEMRFSGFDTARVFLNTENLEDALMGSGSIPMVLDPVTDPKGAPPGRYWDGGIIDYHPNPSIYRGRGLILFPHFYPHLTPGWFDKSFPGRRIALSSLERLVLLVPSPSFVARLPSKKIPDLDDFKRLDLETRVRTWWDVVDRCEVLAEELDELFQQHDPLAGVQPLPNVDSSKSA